MKLKRNYAGCYTGQHGRWEVEIYQAGSKEYWSSTLTCGQYGDDDYQAESLQAETKKQLVQYIDRFFLTH